ncbi:HSF5 [Branchiostoma lanceolatum]|uniref:HSF5 protein n=1 Tax=Branchiostoma lanceolatum TaxID=7740 RepID=A0A8J9ZHQ8_BRALA|nr:HSF5 [Branchiostoma lanceolatum]
MEDAQATQAMTMTAPDFVQQAVGPLGLPQMFWNDFSVSDEISRITYSVNANHFPAKLWILVNDPRIKSIYWDEPGEEVVIIQSQFKDEVLENRQLDVFNTANWDSFVRQLNLYQFKKNIMAARHEGNKDIHRFRNRYFSKGQPDLTMVRRQKKRKRPDSAGPEDTPNKENYPPGRMGPPGSTPFPHPNGNVGFRPIPIPNGQAAMPNMTLGSNGGLAVNNGWAPTYSGERLPHFNAFSQSSPMYGYQTQQCYPMGGQFRAPYMQQRYPQPTGFSTPITQGPNRLPIQTYNYSPYVTQAFDYSAIQTTPSTMDRNDSGNQGDAKVVVEFIDEKQQEFLQAIKAIASVTDFHPKTTETNMIISGDIAIKVEGNNTVNDSGVWDVKDSMSDTGSPPENGILAPISGQSSTMLPTAQSIDQSGQSQVAEGSFITHATGATSASSKENCAVSESALVTTSSENPTTFTLVPASDASVSATTASAPVQETCVTAINFVENDINKTDGDLDNATTDINNSVAPIITSVTTGSSGGDQVVYQVSAIYEYNPTNTKASGATEAASTIGNLGEPFGQWVDVQQQDVHHLLQPEEPTSQ